MLKSGIALAAGRRVYRPLAQIGVMRAKSPRSSLYVTALPGVALHLRTVGFEGSLE